MPRNWALVGIGVHDFGQRFAPRAALFFYEKIARFLLNNFEKNTNY